jgi:hypothetical protein
MAKPLSQKEIVATQQFATSTTLEIESLIALLVEKGIITKDELTAKFKKLDRKMKEIEAK